MKYNYFNLCTPALIYAIYSAIQIILDLFHHFYVVTISKIIVAIIFTYLLNLLCSMGLSIVSWFLILIPFIFTLFIFEILIGLGLVAANNVSKIESEENKKQDKKQNYENMMHQSYPYVDISYSESPLSNDDLNGNEININE